MDMDTRNRRRRNAANDLAALHWAVVSLIWALPITALILQACSCFELTAEWNVLYGLVVGFAAVAFKLKSDDNSQKPSE